MNIIDYLEVHEDFFKIGGYLSQIHNALNAGIAIVALQKNRGAEAGLGGGRGLEKPRVYLALDSNPPEGNTIRVVKAKNYLGENPSGKELDFKLIRDWKLFPTTTWQHVKR